jgi:hypothetical protein
LHYALACGTALVATFLSPSLRAQTIESIPKNSTAVEWSNVDGTRQQGDLYWTVRQVDCEDDVSLLFHLNANDPSRGTFQVWAGQSDCTVQENRTGTNPKCWNLYTGRLTDSKPTIEVSARDIARRLDGDGSVNDCRRTDSEFSLNLYFMHVSGDQTIGTGTQFAMSLDLVGPAAPTGVSVGLREESLAVEWTASVSTDIQGYRLYCEPMGGWENPFLNETSARFGRVVQASTLELDAGTPEAGTGAAGGEASSTGGASAAGGDSAGATADGVGGANSSSVGASTCQGSVLEEGQIPSPDYEPCGKVGPQSERGSRRQRRWRVLRCILAGPGLADKCLRLAPRNARSIVLRSATSPPISSTWEEDLMRALALFCGVGCLVIARAALAQGVDDLGPYGYDENTFASPQHAALELRFGRYLPDVDSEFDSSGQTPFADHFGKKNRYLLGMELDWQALRIPHLGTLGAGVGWGMTKLDGKNFLEADGETLVAPGQVSTLTIMPMYAVAVLRADVISRETPVPLAPYAKFGFGYALWWIDEGTKLERNAGVTAKDVSFGLHGALGVALLLDPFEPVAAADLDATSGINNSYVFVEWTVSDLDGFGGDQMQVGTNTWTLGLTLEM